MPDIDTHPEPGISRRSFLTLSGVGLLALLLPRTARAWPVRQAQPRTILDSIAGTLPLIRRNAWDRSRPIRSRLRFASPYWRITIHHAGTDPFQATSPNAVARELSHIVAAHRDRHFGDIAYHLAIDYAGRVWEGRSLSFEGAHVANANVGNIGILLIGNFERQYPSNAQLIAMGNLVDIVRAKCRIRPSQVYGHRDLSPSMCPGRSLYPYVASLRKTA